MKEWKYTMRAFALALAALLLLAGNTPMARAQVGVNTGTIVGTVLYMEVVFIMVNGCLFWLIIKELKPGYLSAAQVQALQAHLRR